MATWKEQLTPINDLRTQRNNLDQQVYAANLQLQRKQDQLRQAQQKSPGDVQRLQEEIKGQQTEQARNKVGLASARDGLGNLIGGLYGDILPQQLVTQLTDHIPFALLPIRIETRFNPNPRQPELWIRVYPDDVAIYTHEKTLTDAEVTAGENYWTALFTALKAAADDQKKAAWDKLVALFGSGRSAWVALQTKPGNWTDDGSGINDASHLVFPVFDLTSNQSWSRAPRTHVLPDKFVFMCYTGDAKAHEVVGGLIPDELIVGPDPMDANSFVTAGNNLTFGPDFDWASNFDKAIAVGMGVKITLTPQEAANGFDKVLVLGLNLSTDETVSQQNLQDLIDNHHYSPQGFSLLPQGSPAKNADPSGSGFSKSDPFNTISYFVETGKPLFTDADDCDGKDLGDALGIDYAPLQFIAHSNGQDYREAVLLNKALYPGTLGYYAGSLLDPVLPAAAQSSLQDFFTQWVTGRGPIPSFRVGNQPYGVVLTSDLSTWKWQEKETQYPIAFLQTMYNVLNDYAGIWKSLLPKLLYAGAPGQDPSTVLLNILGLQPGSASFFQRNAYSTDDLYNRDSFEYGGKYFTDRQAQFTSKTEGLDWLSSFGYNDRDSTGLLKVPQILRLVYQHYTTTLDPANLVDSLPLSETDPIHFYDTGNKKNYLSWLAAAKTIQDLEQQNFGAGIPAPNALLYLILRKSLLQSLHTGSVNWFTAKAVDFTATGGVTNFFNIRPGGTLTKYEVMKAPLSIADPGHPQAKVAIADYLLGPGRQEPAATIPAAIISALAELASKPTARLERCFTEHLDTLTYRLDAWQTALVNLRLRHLRNLAGPPSTGAPPVVGQPARIQGIYLGSFGWVEDLRPAIRSQVPTQSIPAPLQPTDKSPVYRYANNGGYVHAPSINHASAAAILRSGYLSHASVGAPDAMAVNLSSERVRRAVTVLEGIRNGQPIEALLGYQFERGLHDQGSALGLLRLNEYIYDFRDKFAIATNLVQQQGAAAQETIPANDVVNGLLLSQATGAFPYGATGDVVSATVPEQTAIATEKDKLSDTLDAVKDLLMVESVYQLTIGNFDRAGAVINSLQDGTAPPEIDSIASPKGSHLSFTNRVTIQFANGDPALPATNPWPAITMTARAKMETGINKWLGVLLGDPGALGVQVSKLDDAGVASGTINITLDKLGLQPVDLLYMAGRSGNTGDVVANKENKTGTSELESRIAYVYRTIQGIGDSIRVGIGFLAPQGVVGLTPFGQLLPLFGTIRTLLTDSRYLNAQDFDPPQFIPTDKNNPRGYDTAELTTRVNKVKTDYEGLLAALQAIAIDAQLTDAGGTTVFFNKLGDIFTALDNAKLGFSDISFTFTTPNATLLQTQLLTIANASLGNAFPQVSVVGTDAAKLALLEQGRSIARTMINADKQAVMLLAQTAGVTDASKVTDILVNAGKALLSSEFNILPLFKYHNEADVLASNSDRDQLLSYAGSLNMNFPADEWLQNSAHVRPRLARWDYVRTLAETINKPMPVNPVQLPYRIKDSWLAVEFPSTDPNDPTKPFSISDDTISVVIHGDQAFVAGAAHCGILVDDWAEKIPTKEQLTGIAFNYDRPNTFPPQAILLTIPAQITGQWTWDGLVNILNDTLLRAKLRAVEPQLLATVDKAQTSVLLPALLSNFTQFDLDLSLDYRMNLAYVVKNLPTLAVGELLKN
jgi:hypothetical protein